MPYDEKDGPEGLGELGPNQDDDMPGIESAYQRHVTRQVATRAASREAVGMVKWEKFEEDMKDTQADRLVELFA